MAAVTLEELVEAVGISPESLSQRCSDEHLMSISQFLDWRITAPYLGLNEAEIKAIDEGEKREEEKRLKTLEKWKATFLFKATYKMLVEKLLTVRRADHAEKVCQLLVSTPGIRQSDSPHEMNLPPSQHVASPKAQPPIKVPRMDVDSGGDSLYYKSTKNPGRAIIISNECFNPPPGKTPFKQRRGTKVDRDNLDRTFTVLGYDTDVYNDLTASAIENKFERLKGKRHGDSLVCCLLSHGREGKIYGSDQKFVSIRKLARMLASCESLKRKPKIFFIQACQGSDKPPQQRGPDDGEEEDPDEGVAALPRDSDFFFGYATTPETSAIRDFDDGSWYIKELCRSLNKREYRRNHDLVTLVTLVHNEVATNPDYAYDVKDKETGKVTHVYRQQPQLVSTLRHLVRLPTD